MHSKRVQDITVNCDVCGLLGASDCFQKERFNINKNKRFFVESLSGYHLQYCMSPSGVTLKWGKQNKKDQSKMNYQVSKTFFLHSVLRKLELDKFIDTSLNILRGSK